MSASDPNINQILQGKRQEILRLAAKHGAYNVRVFGSVARGEAGPKSDVDFLVDMDASRTLFDLAGLLVGLQNLLGCDVDIVETEGLHHYIRDQVIREAVAL